MVAYQLEQQYYVNFSPKLDTQMETIFKIKQAFGCDNMSIK